MVCEKARTTRTGGKKFNIIKWAVRWKINIVRDCEQLEFETRRVW